MRFYMFNSLGTVSEPFLPNCLIFLLILAYLGEKCLLVFGGSVLPPGFEPVKENSGCSFYTIRVL